VRTVADYSILDSSLGTYASSWHKFLEFCRVIKVDPRDPKVPYRELLDAFLVYAVEDADSTLIPDSDS